MVKNPMAKKIVIDIETIGRDFESFDKLTKENLLKSAETEEDIQEAKDKLSLSPLTGEIAAIGMLEIESDKGFAYFQAGNNPPLPFEESSIEYFAGTEEGLLKKFWETVKRYDQIITFNGRAFDAPFIILRSAVLKIKPSKDLMPPRFNSTSHVDLFDQLTFLGAVSRKNFSLHMCCKAFGIESPKEQGITGLEVGDLYKKGRYLDIAKYCLGDLHATKNLFKYWNDFVKFP